MNPVVGLVLMTFYNVQNLTALIVLKLTESLSILKGKQPRCFPNNFTSQLDTSHFS